MVITQRSDGLYYYREHRYYPEIGCGLDLIPAGWYPMAESGLFSAIEDAEAEARATLPWLRGD